MSTMYALQHALQDQVISGSAPYPDKRFAGRGIVICAGGPRLFTCAWVCINTLRRTTAS